MNISPHLHTKIFFQRRYILSKSDHAHSPPTSLLTCSVNQSQTKTISAFFKTLHLHSKRWQGEGELVRELTSLCSRYIYIMHILPDMHHQDTCHRSVTHLFYFALMVTIQIYYILSRIYLKKRKKKILLKFLIFVVWMMVWL